MMVGSSRFTRPFTEFWGLQFYTQNPLTFQASQRGSLRSPQAMMVGSSRYTRPFTELRRSSAWRTFWRYRARAPASV